ncbi:MAG: cupredoxin domain-containing protein [Acidimicrobiales bacterium]
MQRRRLAIGAMLAVAIGVGVLLALLMGGDDDGDGDATPAGTQTVSMVEMAFEPDPIEAEAGNAVLRVVNDGAVEHSLVVQGAGKGTPDLEPDQEMTLDLRELEAGSYRVICDIPGHVEAGMVTTLNLG